VIHPDEALELIESLDIRLEVEAVALADALGRVPARVPTALLDQPPFDKSTMDGFAYASFSGRLAEPGEAFLQTASVAAGSPPPERLAPGECARVMTGAPVPEGSVAVHRLERAELRDGRVTVLERELEPQIVRRAQNGLAGDELFPTRPLRPQDLGLLAAHGIAGIEVVRRPRVLVLSSGDELEGPGRSLGPGRIYDSNGPMLVAQATAFGCDAGFFGAVGDDEATLREAIEAAAERADLVIASGGVSAGDFDYVPAAAQAAGFSLLFRGLAMKPGMPALLGRRGRGFLYGMPGNPVSAFVNFEVLAKPLLRRFSGIGYAPRTARLRLARRVARQDASRVEFLPAKVEGDAAQILRYTGSTMLGAIVRADALLRLEIGQAEIAEGETVDARLL
jgi:molybdopterin molybdotransferase